MKVLRKIKLHGKVFWLVFANIGLSVAGLLSGVVQQLFLQPAWYRGFARIP